MSNILFEGIYSATFSLYDENLNVKKDSVEKLIAYNEKNGVRGFYVGGNTGECTTLPNRTRRQMAETVKACAAPGSKVIIHVGAGHLEDVADLVDHANSLGADAVASLPPSLTAYYRAPEIIEYYRWLAARSKAPVLAYVTPVLNCDLRWFGEQIMAIPNIIGLKVSIPNYYTFEQLKTIRDGDINILNGPDECMMAGLAMGADGAIGTTYNLMPATAVAVYDNFKAGRIGEARVHQHRMNRFIDVLLSVGGIAAWKSVLKVLDIDPGWTVAPAAIPDDAQYAAILARLKANGSYDYIG